MVAKITIPRKIIAALNYNENKVSRGKAECLSAGNFLKDAQEMSFYQKLEGFERLNVLNERAATKTLHISLNFDPSEKFSSDKLIMIASDYMSRIGFGEQPFLIYKHGDAGHPHIHIVSTTIKADGSRINTHNIGRNQSEKARKEIENLYSLIRAEKQQQLIKPGIKPIDIIKAIYGKQETKQSISNVVGAVFSQYKFTSLPEFNAALKQFNIVADRGKEEGRIYKNRGLVYRILDAGENKVGVPIKASSINCKPTLNNLDKKFATNELAREPLKQKTKNAIDNCLQSAPGSMKNLVAALEQKKIYTVLRQNAEGRLYGITFVDNQNKCVFNGSDLGKSYSASHLQSQILSTGVNNEKQLADLSSNNPYRRNNKPEEKSGKADSPLLVKNDTIHESEKLQSEQLQVLGDLLSAEKQLEKIPFQLMKKKKRRKKKSLGL